MRIAFLGMGIMGSRMATNLAAAGHEVVVWNRTPGKAAMAVAAGAQEANSPAAAAQEADVLISILSTPQAVESTALGGQGFLDAMRPGSLWIDSSTVNPSFSRRMAGEAAARKLRFLDAPVSGSKPQAAAGQLVFYVGGEMADLDEARPLLSVMGRAVYHLGGVGMGASFKMVNNMLAAQNVLAFSETLALGQSLGISLEKLLEIFIGGPMAAPFLAGKVEKITSGDFEADFPLQWMQKDLHLAALTAYEAGIALPLVNLAKEIYMQAAQAGLADADFSAVYAWVNKKNGKNASQ